MDNVKEQPLASQNRSHLGLRKTITIKEWHYDVKTGKVVKYRTINKNSTKTPSALRTAVSDSWIKTKKNWRKAFRSLSRSHTNDKEDGHNNVCNSEKTLRSENLEPASIPKDGPSKYRSCSKPRNHRHWSKIKFRSKRHENKETVSSHNEFHQSKSTPDASSKEEERETCLFMTRDSCTIPKLLSPLEPIVKNYGEPVNKFSAATEHQFKENYHNSPVIGHPTITRNDSSPMITRGQVLNKNTTPNAPIRSECIIKQHEAKTEITDSDQQLCTSIGKSTYVKDSIDLSSVNCDWDDVQSLIKNLGITRYGSSDVFKLTKDKKVPQSIAVFGERYNINQLKSSLKIPMTSVCDENVVNAEANLKKNDFTRPLSATHTQEGGLKLASPDSQPQTPTKALYSPYYTSNEKIPNLSMNFFPKVQETMPSDQTCLSENCINRHFVDSIERLDSGFLFDETDPKILGTASWNKPLSDRTGSLDFFENNSNHIPHMRYHKTIPKQSTDHKKTVPEKYVRPKQEERCIATGLDDLMPNRKMSNNISHIEDEGMTTILLPGINSTVRHEGELEMPDNLTSILMHQVIEPEKINAVNSEFSRKTQSSSENLANSGIYLNDSTQEFDLTFRADMICHVYKKQKGFFFHFSSTDVDSGCPVLEIGNKKVISTSRGKKFRFYSEGGAKLLSLTATIE